MVSDGVRMDAYTRAIERSVRPGAVVLDIGAGTGVFSLLAARAGARRVYAVDPNPAIQLAKELAHANGFGDRIEVFEASSFDVDLPEKADVVVSDLRGSLPVYEHHLAILRDAKARLLAPEGTIIPALDRLVVGVVECDTLWESLARPLAAYARLGFEVDSLRRCIFNTRYSDRGSPLSASNLLTSAGVWGEIRYGVTHGTLEGEVSLRARRDGVAHGLAVWFESELLDGIEYGTAPGHELVYGRGYLPFEEPVQISLGDRAAVAMRVDERGERWAWDVRVDDEHGVVKTKLRQTTFFGLPTNPQALLRAASTHAPKLSPRGVRTRAILDAMDGTRTVDEIAALLGARYGSRADQTLDDVRDATRRYGD